MSGQQKVSACMLSQESHPSLFVLWQPHDCRLRSGIEKRVKSFLAQQKRVSHSIS